MLALFQNIDLFTVFVHGAIASLVPAEVRVDYTKLFVVFRLMEVNRNARDAFRDQTAKIKCLDLLWQHMNMSWYPPLGSGHILYFRHYNRNAPSTGSLSAVLYLVKKCVCANGDAVLWSPTTKGMIYSVVQPFIHNSRHNFRKVPLVNRDAQWIEENEADKANIAQNLRRLATGNEKCMERMVLEMWTNRHGIVV